MKKKIYLLLSIGLVSYIGLGFAARSRLRKADQPVENESVVQPQTNDQTYDALPVVGDLVLPTDNEQLSPEQVEDIAIQSVQEHQNPQPTVSGNYDKPVVGPDANGDSDGSQLVSEDEFNEEKKRKQVIALVEKGANFLAKNQASVAFRMFTHSTEFDLGELYLFVIDTNGVCFADGQESQLLWKNLLELRDSFGVPIAQNMIKTAKEGGGWVTYQWRNATKVSYVKQVKSGGKTYIIASGYYPHSKKNAVVNLVKGAVSYCGEVKAKGLPIDDAFSSISYPLGRFVYGDLYLYALDFKGTLMAQGDRPGLIGTNAWEVRSSEGKATNQEIINRLKNSDEGVWISYVSKNAKKYAYAEKVTDSKGEPYAIICGYYPDANRDKAVELVKKGYTYMKANGKRAAVQEFTDRNIMEFRYGDLSLFVYDYKGVCIASGLNPEYVGQNHYDFKDEDGRYYVRDMIQKAKDGGGWIDFKIKNSFQSTYVEPIDFGLQEQYVIGAGTFPISKSETMSLLVRSGASFLKAHTDEEAMQEFTRHDGRFIRGDLSLFVFDPTGLCYASGDDYDLIWQNLIDKKDDTGKPYVKLFINTVKQGAAKITYVVNKIEKIAYVDRVNKADKTFILGSSFYK